MIIYQLFPTRNFMENKFYILCEHNAGSNHLFLVRHVAIGLESVLCDIERVFDILGAFVAGPQQ